MKERAISTAAILVVLFVCTMLFSCIKVNCPTGFTGPDCTTTNNAQYIDTFYGTMEFTSFNSHTYSSGFPFVITAYPGSPDSIFVNYGVLTSLGGSAYAGGIVIGAINPLKTSEFTIPAQSQDSNNVTFSGSGTLTGDTGLAVTINQVDAFGTVAYTFTGTKH